LFKASYLTDGLNSEPVQLVFMPADVYNRKTLVSPFDTQ